MEELDAVKEQNSEYFSRLQRLQADFDNYKRRTKIETENLSKYSSFELIKELLAIADNLALALEVPQTGAAQAIIEGVELIHKQLCDILSRNGVTAIKTVGELFDPYLHEAIMSDCDDNLPDDVITDEIQRGYKLHDRVIRHSKVKVNKSMNKVD